VDFEIEDEIKNVELLIADAQAIIAYWQSPASADDPDIEYKNSDIHAAEDEIINLTRRLDYLKRRTHITPR